ncbi:JAB domain-containing protein, partial [Blautia pseudococcoides]|nr:JAB domain-containing protein [Blautia pseudococcoides]
MTENHLDFVHVCLKVDKTLYSDKELKDDKSVVELMREELMQYDREIICLLNLTTKSQVINAQIVSMGTINESIINSREVFKASILSNASQIILMHNHPSGNPEPSKADMAITKKLVTAGKILGIEVIDHIIVGGRTGDSFSFAKGGL